ncbi:MAG: ABC transporter ATP-binding protein [Bacteroidetes bacterium]|nr:ABC transporter ATP-binding protein [Bacteroidota bacterium]MCH8523782.1 ABC transporter ATP-binding protein [Balneolales bacterium]
MKPLLSVENIRKQYVQQIVLNDLDLTVNEGEFFFLLGPSGCGKTTLLRILSGLLEPDAGRIVLNGTDITHTPAHLRDVNTVFQNYALFPHMNVFDNVAFGLRMKKVSETKVRENVTEALRLVSLPDFSSRMPSQMSGGQMQRVALARAIVNEPSVLLLDEPLGALDVKLRKQMQSELRQLQRKLGTTFICVTHDQDEALTLGDRIAVMNKGRFEQISDAHTLYNQPVSHYVCDFLGECNFLEGSVQQATSTGCRVSVHDGFIEASAPGFKEADQVTVGIRPEKIALNATDETRQNQLQAVVSERIFTGNHYQIECITPAGSHLNVLFMNNGSLELPEQGASVQLSWKNEDTIILPMPDKGTVNAS